MRSLPRPLVWTGAALLTAAALALMYRPGYERRRRMEAALVAAEAAHARLEAREAELAARVGRLEADPLEVEREARHQLGLVRPGEVIYKFPVSAAP